MNCIVNVWIDGFEYESVDLQRHRKQSRRATERNANHADWLFRMFAPCELDCRANVVS